MQRKTDNFNKFFNKKNNAAIKEQFRQEKKAAKKERKEAIERHFEEKRKARQQQAEVPKKSLSLKRGPGGKSALPGQSAAPAKAAGAGGNGGSGEGPLPLNKYIAHGGLCSRRDAADLIREGKVQVNGQIVTEPGTKVSPDDLVKVNGKKVTISRNFVYILLNKPKDYITTTDDPQGRRTVLDLIRQATTERVFPVGRLDRNTSGVLLLTNDGDLAQKLAHPRHEIKKIYHVTLDKQLTKADFDTIIAGEVVLEDGPAIVDVIAYADSRDKTQIGLEIHSGRNRIVRRIFEHLGYDVRGLDRVTYAGLTKKNVQRGKWRLLTEKEIRILKYLNSSFKGSPDKNANKNLQREQAIQNAIAIQTESDPDDDEDDYIDPRHLLDPNDDEKTDTPKEAQFKKLPGKKKPPTVTLKNTRESKPFKSSRTGDQAPEGKPFKGRSSEGRSFKGRSEEGGQSFETGRKNFKPEGRSFKAEGRPSKTEGRSFKSEGQSFKPKGKPFKSASGEDKPFKPGAKKPRSFKPEGDREDNLNPKSRYARSGSKRAINSGRATGNSGNPGKPGKPVSRRSEKPATGRTARTDRTSFGRPDARKSGGPKRAPRGRNSR